MVFYFVGKRKPLYLALKQSLFLSLGVGLSGQILAQEANSEWLCGADASGQWLCEQKETEGYQYARPKRQPLSRPSTPEEPRVPITSNLDWVPIEQLSEEEKQKVRPNCCGAYIDPPREYEDGNLDPGEAPLRVSADTTEAQGNIAKLQGDVQVSQGYRQVRSNSASVDREQRAVELEGNITYREPGVLVTGDSAKVNMDSGEMTAANVVFVLHESNVRGEASAISRPSENKIHIDDALYTSCEPGSEAWTLRASSVDINTSKSVATARNMRLNVRNVPVLYMPWLRFPISNNRATGLLFPSILTGNDNGLDYAQPIYLNLAPQYDATLTPRIIQERGSMAELEFRHLSRSTETTLSGGYLWDDKGGSNNEVQYLGQDRWSVGLDHQGGMGTRWNTFIDYTDISDIDYFRDIDSATLEISSASHLNQQIKAGYVTDHWDLAIQTQKFETLILDGLEQYQQLPRIDANGQYRFGDSDFIVGMKQNAIVFDHSEDDVVGSGTPYSTDNQNTTITGTRFRGDYSITWDKEWLWGFFKPRLATKYLTYNLDDPLINQTQTSPDVVVPVGSIDAGLFFERETNWVSGHIQTIEPRIYYLKSSYEDQSAIPNFDTSELTFGYYQLFRDDRFSGGDRIGDTEQATFGITSRLIDSYSGQEKLRFSLGQVYYLEDRRVTLTPEASTELTQQNSDIAVEFAGNFADHWRFQTDLLTTNDGGTINKGNLSLGYNNRENTVFNLSYRYTRRDNVLSGGQFVRADIDQAALSFALPIAGNWTILGRYNQDLRTNQELEIFAGLEYSSCCWRTSIVARRWVDRDDNFIIGSENLEHNNGVFLQIQFRGLAGLSKRVDNILREGIYGYQPPEN
ncbi:MAG: LPS assembly protein LptD [Porticoccaceae bacterium]|nr:LPS assembly protein LptD [Porticoccaceae bacterium]